MELPLPCPLEAGWELVRTIELPRTLADGRSLGGFSAAAYQPRGPSLVAQRCTDWASSALGGWPMARGSTRHAAIGPQSSAEGWRRAAPARGFDGEGLVIEGRQAWIASETTLERPTRPADPH